MLTLNERGENGPRGFQINQDPHISSNMCLLAGVYHDRNRITIGQNFHCSPLFKPMPIPSASNSAVSGPVGSAHGGAHRSFLSSNLLL